MGSWSTTDPDHPVDDPRVAELEAEIRDARGLVDDLFRSNPEPMWIVDRETLGFLDVNDAAVALYGYTRDEFLAMTLLDVRPEEHSDEFWVNHRRLGDSRWSRIDPVTHRRVDGSTMLVEPTIHQMTHLGRPARLARLRRLSDEEVAERRLAGVSGLLVDRLTAIVDVWRELSERYRTVDELLDVVPEVALGILGADGAILFRRDGADLVPRSFAGHLADAPRLPVEHSLTGWVYRRRSATRSEDYNHDPRAIVLQSRLEESRALVAAPIPGVDEPVGVIVVLDRRAGRFDEADERTLDLLGRALGTLVRRLEVEAAHQLTDQRLRSVVEATTDSFYDWDIDADTVWWGSAAGEVFGSPLGQLGDGLESWTGRIHPDDRAELGASLDAALTTPSTRSWTSSYRFRRDDGSYAHIRDRAVIERHADGRPRRVIGGMADVSEVVEAEQRLLQSQRLEAVGQLTGGLAHDFNNLLTVVLGNADQLIDDLPDGHAELIELARTVRAAAVRGADLAQQLLSFARRQPLDPRPTDIDAFLGELGRFLSRTIPENIGIELSPGNGATVALVDPAQLQNALVNLCLNARDAMPAGGRLSITTAIETTDDAATLDGVVGDVATPDGSAPDGASGAWVVISIADTGVGIEPELLARVVEPFFTTKVDGAGSGLGLSMVHGFVSQSGGRLDLSSTPGEGTVVRLYLPAVDGAAEQPMPTPEAEIPEARPGERVLAVEDDPLVRRLVVRQLTGLGYEVHEAESGPEALDLLGRLGSVDLLFTDVVMPGGMDGRELARVAVERQPDLSVLYTSGYSEDAIVHDGRLDEGVALLMKPYRVADLARRVREVLDAPPSPRPSPPRSPREP